MKGKILNFLKGIGTIFLYVFLSIVGALLFGKNYYSDNKLIASLSQLGTYFLILIVLVIIYHKRIKNDFKNFKKEYFNIALKNWIIGLGAMVIANIIIANFVHDIAVNESLNRELLNNYPISNIISMIFIGPFIEEIIFRASFKGAFDKWYTFAFVTAFIFGFAHIIAGFTSVAEANLMELLFIIPYGTLGFFFAKAFYETDNIFTSFSAHMLHNALAIICIFLV